MAPLLLSLGLLISLLGITDAESVGVCYGRNGNNLPSQQDVVSLYKSNNIRRMRIYDPDQRTLTALRGSNIELILGVPNDRLQSLTEPSAATQWVRDNVVPYASGVKIKYIAVGNEVHPGDGKDGFVLRAMQNIQNAIVAANLQGQIKVSTAIDTKLIEGYPPSAGKFTNAASSYIKPIISFLDKNGSPLLANIYTYFAYVDNPRDIKLEYALFTSPGVVITDQQYQYQNLFDALLDTLYAALEKAGGGRVRVVVSESGWPSEGGSAATASNAGTYYKGLINRVRTGKGSPRKSGQAIETYLFAMFDENAKGGPAIEQHFGLFRPNKQNKYGITNFG